MRVLLLGSGGRESALAAALHASPSVTELVVAPGNPGVQSFATRVPVDTNDPKKVAELAGELRPALVVIGPEAPLVAGVADALRDGSVPVFGPNAQAARIEASKSYAKSLMNSVGVPTSAGRVFDSMPGAVAFLDELGPPYVVKADGLAAGKGVVVTSDRERAIAAVEQRVVDRVFGDQGSRVVIEEYLEGPEVSLIAFCDGSEVVACEPAQDYKRIADGDRGPNTGGMGSYSPVPVCPPAMVDQISEEIIRPVVAATDHAGAPFVGALYAGLALTTEGPKVVEFNVRFGDPETQALIPRLRSDFCELCAASAAGELAGMKAEWKAEACVAVVLASQGYPAEHDVGLPISGIDEADAMLDVSIFQAGTDRRNGDLVTAGGRVLAVSALGPTFDAARRRAYDAAAVIEFEGKHLRTDIGLRAVEEQ